jgi:hypothetical protein
MFANGSYCKPELRQHGMTWRKLTKRAHDSNLLPSILGRESDPP